MTKNLFPTFNNPDKWRSPVRSRLYNTDRRKEIRQQALKRDKNTCVFCGFQAEKYMIAHHINDDPDDLRLENLETICPMCNLIIHIGQGAVIQGIVDLYKGSNYSQENIIRIARQLRALGKSDEEIILKLGLKEKVPFKQNLDYLSKLYGFITSRKGQDDMTIRGLSYVYWEYKNQLNERFRIKQLKLEY